VRIHGIDILIYQWKKWIPDNSFRIYGMTII